MLILAGKKKLDEDSLGSTESKLLEGKGTCSTTKPGRNGMDRRELSSASSSSRVPIAGLDPVWHLHRSEIRRYEPSLPEGSEK